MGRSGEMENIMKTFLKSKNNFAIPVIGKDFTQIKQAIKEINKLKQINSIEVRLDYFENEITDEVLKNIRSLTEKKLIATFRCELDGGRLKSYSPERINYLKQAVKNGFDIVDIEYNRIRKTKIKEIINEIKLINEDVSFIISVHEFQKNLKYGHVKLLIKNIKVLKPDLIKIVFCVDKTPNLKNFIKMMFDFKKGCKFPLSLIGLGKYSKLCRILSFYFKQNLIFLSLKEGQESAKGQLSYKDYFDILKLLT